MHFPAGLLDHWDCEPTLPGFTLGSLHGSNDAENNVDDAKRPKDEDADNDDRQDGTDDRDDYRSELPVEGIPRCLTSQLVARTSLAVVHQVDNEGPDEPGKDPENPSQYRHKAAGAVGGRGGLIRHGRSP